MRSTSARPWQIMGRTSRHSVPLVRVLQERHVRPRARARAGAGRGHGDAAEAATGGAPGAGDDDGGTGGGVDARPRGEPLVPAAGSGHTGRNDDRGALILPDPRHSHPQLPQPERGGRDSGRVRRPAAPAHAVTSVMGGSRRTACPNPAPGVPSATGASRRLAPELLPRLSPHGPRWGTVALGAKRGRSGPLSTPDAVPMPWSWSTAGSCRTAGWNAAPAVSSATGG